MRRRDFIVLTAGVAAWPRGSRAQERGRIKRVVLLMAAYAQSDREGQARVTAFIDTFQKLGWSDGRNVRIEYRWEAGNATRIKTSATELVHSKPDVIVVVANQALSELHQLTTTIPIVFTQVSDILDSGLVAGLSRPGGNITGFQTFDAAMGGKWLGVLKEASPQLNRVAVLFGSDSGGNVGILREVEAVAPSLGISVSTVDVKDAGGIENAVNTFASQPNGGLIVVPHPYTIANRSSIIVLAAGHHLPALYPLRYFATEGGLMSYGPDQIEQWRGAASYVDRILRGEKPGELPIQAPSRFELVINMKTAKALGLDIPPTLPLRADEVIE